MLCACCPPTILGDLYRIHWETKGRFRKRAVLANVPSFRFSFWRNMRAYPRSGFRSGEHPNVPSFRFSFRGNIRQNHPFEEPPFCQPPNNAREFAQIVGADKCTEHPSEKVRRSNRLELPFSRKQGPPKPGISKEHILALHEQKILEALRAYR